MGASIHRLHAGWGQLNWYKLKAAPVLQTNLFMTVNCAKLKKNWIVHLFKGITFRTDVYNDLSFVTG